MRPPADTPHNTPGEFIDDTTVMHCVADNPQHTQETPRQAHNGLKALSCPLCRSNGTILIDLPQCVIHALRHDATCSHCGTRFESLSITQAEGGSCSLTWTRRGG